MALPKCLAASALGFVVLRTSFPPVVKGALAAVLAAPLLLLPVGLPTKSSETMMTSVVSFLFASTLVAKVITPPPPPPPQTAPPAPPAPPSLAAEGVKPLAAPTLSSSESPVRAFGRWMGQFLWFMLPLEEIPPHRRNWDGAYDRAVENIVSAGCKLVLLPVFMSALRDNATVASVAAAQGDAGLRLRLTLLFLPTVMLGVWSNDLMAGIVTLATGGRYTVVVFNNYPFFSASLAEFWGRRYNRLISTWLNGLVFAPLRPRIGAPWAVLASFTLSGILHAYVAHFAFGHGEASAMAFFLLHGLGTIAEGHIVRRYPHAVAKVPHVVRVHLTLAFFVLTLPLYPALFIDSMPEWLAAKTPVPVAALQRFSEDTLYPLVRTSVARFITWNGPSF